MTSCRQLVLACAPQPYWLLVILALMVMLVPQLQAAPCYPSDPEGENPGNLCPTYPPSGMTLDSNTFRPGSATEGYFGRPLGPTLPGTPVVKGHNPRTPIDPRAGADGYWTSIEATNGMTQIRTNTGRQWNLKVPTP